MNTKNARFVYHSIAAHTIHITKKLLTLSRRGIISKYARFFLRNTKKRSLTKPLATRYVGWLLKTAPLQIFTYIHPMGARIARN